MLTKRSSPKFPNARCTTRHARRPRENSFHLEGKSVRLLFRTTLHLSRNKARSRIVLAYYSMNFGITANPLELGPQTIFIKWTAVNLAVLRNAQRPASHPRQ